MTFEMNGIKLTLETEPALFSPNAADRGTLVMLDAADTLVTNAIYENSPIKLLDLGCGYGLAGLYFLKRYGNDISVHMSDIDPAAVVCAHRNAEANGVQDVKFFVSDGFRDIYETGYNIILSNPPYHADFSVAKRFIEKGFNRLAPNGAFFMVTKRREWYKQKFISIFGGVTVSERGGYFVFMGEKRNSQYAAKTARSSSRR